MSYTSVSNSVEHTGVLQPVAGTGPFTADANSVEAATPLSGRGRTAASFWLDYESQPVPSSNRDSSTPVQTAADVLPMIEPVLEVTLNFDILTAGDLHQWQDMRAMIRQLAADTETSCEKRSAHYEGLTNGILEQVDELMARIVDLEIQQEQLRVRVHELEAVARAQSPPAVPAIAVGVAHETVAVDADEPVQAGDPMPNDNHPSGVHVDGELLEEEEGPDVARQYMENAERWKERAKASVRLYAQLSAVSHVRRTPLATRRVTDEESAAIETPAPRPAAFSFPFAVRFSSAGKAFLQVLWICVPQPARPVVVDGCRRLIDGIADIGRGRRRRGEGEEEGEEGRGLWGRSFTVSTPNVSAGDQLHIAPNGFRPFSKKRCRRYREGMKGDRGTWWLCRFIGGGRRLGGTAEVPVLESSKAKRHLIAPLRVHLRHSSSSTAYCVAGGSGGGYSLSRPRRRERYAACYGDPASYTFSQACC
ncbi:uncharacterized protein SCHCODRAFT_02602804 [Schizophyllum commune H4-8]|uniref:Uncharacterized protein n=1 Tax=Schizophyllum commune (strain H4-8 / FGSC 9210) TaxID=578458 RepID=D8QHG8_SCHCM|nr:uncharacterized protein SCHCODRAFT_02602804 [Schizophyllum commune H4-8]KAI5887180.1 hypothetical protein SCHCODRAFT_02602804 [Schizophyllum commune H4-8]